MSWDLLFPALSALLGIVLTALLTPLFKARFSSEERAALLSSQTQALSTYWQRIEELEADVDRLVRENERLMAQVGRMQMRLDRYERGQ